MRLTSTSAQLLAYAIAHLGGRAGLSAWRWIFIIEGVFTVASAVATWFLLVDAPSSTVACTWLTDEEKKYLELRQASRRVSSSSSSREYRDSSKGKGKGPSARRRRVVQA